MDGLAHIVELVTWIRKSKSIASELVDKEHERLVKGGEVGMSATEKAINDLNVSKLMLCNSKMLTSEMCVRIGQAINGAIDLLKEQEPIQPTINEYGKAYCICGENVGIIPDSENLPKIRFKYCPECGRRIKWER